MKTILLPIAFLLLVFDCSGQRRKQILKKYNFDEGGYSLVGTMNTQYRFFQDSINDSIGDFYTDDISLLTQIKDAWVFAKVVGQKGSRIWCHGFDGYSIYILKQGKPLENLAIACVGYPFAICTQEAAYWYTLGKIQIFKDKLKPLFKEVKEIKEVDEAGAYYHKLLQDTNCFSTSITISGERDPIWNWESRYEGRFSFYYPKRKSPFSERDVHWNLMRYIDEELSFKYPNDYLEVDILDYNEQKEGDSLSKNDTVFLCQIRCRKSLFDKFDLYQKASDWQPYSFLVKTYWKRKPD